MYLVEMAMRNGLRNGPRQELPRRISPGRAGIRDPTPDPSRQSVPSHHSAPSVRFDEEVRSTAGRRPSASPARDVEHSAGATASRLPLFAHLHPTALQLHAATAHTDVERLLLSARCWHGCAMTGANGKLFAAADIKRSDLALDKLCCLLQMACKWARDYRGHGPAPVGTRSVARQLSARPLHRPAAWQRRAE